MQEKHELIDESYIKFALEDELRQFIRFIDTYDLPEQDR